METRCRRLVCTVSSTPTSDASICCLSFSSSSALSHTSCREAPLPPRAASEQERLTLMEGSSSSGLDSVRNIFSRRS
eukprot:766555-Hanusia_phi.AAC.11